MKALEGPPQFQTEREKALVEVLRGLEAIASKDNSVYYHEFDQARSIIKRFDHETRFMAGRTKVYPGRKSITVIEGQDHKWWWTLSESPTAFNYNGIDNHSRGFDTQGEAISAAVLAADEADEAGTKCENSP